MKRIAILIGSPSHQSTPRAGKFLSGVRTDILNMKRFLLSSIGGSWNEKNEIKVFPENPNYSDIAPFLLACKKVDIAFIYFSGHGYTDNSDNPRIILNPREDTDVLNQLANLAKRQITIIDACRSYPRFIGFEGVTLREGIEFPNPKPIFAREIYDYYISNIPDAKALLFSSSKGESSMDYGVNYGGLFSTSLLSVVKSKLKTDKKAIIKIAEVFETAKINTQINEPKQRPEIFITDNNAYKLPFAVNPDLPMARQPQEKVSIRKTTLAKKIALGVLSGAAIYLTGRLIGSIIKGSRS